MGAYTLNVKTMVIDASLMLFSSRMLLFLTPLATLDPCPLPVLSGLTQTRTYECIS